MTPASRSHRAILREIARQAMVDAGFCPDYGQEVGHEMAAIRAPAASGTTEAADLRAQPWSSIDNDDSHDLDQLTLWQPLEDERARILVAVADVDALVGVGSAIDAHARCNTTTIYTPAERFWMLPPRLCTDLTSLVEGQDRLAVVVDAVVDADGALTQPRLYRALVRNQARLSYSAVGDWLEGLAPVPPGVARVNGLADQLRRQDEVARRLSRRRHEHGALTLETIEPKATFVEETIVDFRIDARNRARELIEDFMIAANESTARFLEQRGYPSLRRVVRRPRRWERIVEIARSHGYDLPRSPDAESLQRFLEERRAADPLRFPDLSLTIVKLLGSGEYVAERAHAESAGHFGLAVRNYTHSTAPNRRYPDVISQRLVKAAVAGAPSPYSVAELRQLAEHCTEREDQANRVERQVRKSAAALLMSSHVGQRFDGVVTGASVKGTWVRLLAPPAEGRIVAGERGLDVGDRIRVELVGTDVERGYIDFRRG